MTLSFPLHLTDAAARRVRELADEHDGIGLRLGVVPKGCSGMSYALDVARERRAHEDEVVDKGARVLVDPAAALFLAGTRIDWRDGRLESGFTFDNPNERGRCGCGESFTV